MIRNDLRLQAAFAVLALASIDNIASAQTKQFTSFGSTAAAGYINFDDCFDIAVGHSQADSSKGYVKIYLQNVSGSTCLHTFTDVDTVTEDALGGSRVSGNEFGFAVVAGDFDCDGRDDLAIG